MTMGEIWDFEATLGRKATQQELNAEKTRRLMEIKAYANQTGYTDVTPYEVVRKVSDICVEVRAMKAKQIKFPQDVRIGGFSAHTVDNRSGQDYEYSSDETREVFKIRWSRANRQWQRGKYIRFSMSDKPYKFYDYNF